MPRVVVTGASRGIGLEFCRQLRERGAEVVAACRRATPELQALGVTVVEGVDVADDATLAPLRAAVDGAAVDVLINNAGILRPGGFEDLAWDDLRAQFEVNALGPLRVTRGLVDRLARGAKVAMVTSRMGSIADNTSGGAYGYRMSKAALNIASVSLAHDLRDRDVSIAILHPGYVRTDMTSKRGNLDPQTSVRGMLARIDALGPQTSGTFWLHDGEVLPW